MSPARSGIDIGAPADGVWRLLTEFRAWPEWGPSVRGVESEAEAVAAGVTGRVRTALGVWLPFVIEEFEEERYWDWSVAGLRATGHRVSPLSADRTRVVFTVSRLYLPYVPVLAWGLHRLKRIAEADG